MHRRTHTHTCALARGRARLRLFSRFTALRPISCGFVHSALCASICVCSRASLARLGVQGAAGREEGEEGLAAHALGRPLSARSCTRTRALFSASLLSFRSSPAGIIGARMHGRFRGKSASRKMKIAESTGKCALFYIQKVWKKFQTPERYAYTWQLRT